MLRRTDLRLDRHGWAALAGVVVSLAVARPVRAEAAETGGQVDPKQEAKAHFKAGQTHYNLNENVEALGEFKAAYRLFPDPVFLYNLAQCERRLGHYDEAIRFYRGYLREQPQAPNREEVQRKIDEMEAAPKSRGGEAEEKALVPPATVDPGKNEPHFVTPAKTEPSAGYRQTEASITPPVPSEPARALPLPAVEPEESERPSMAEVTDQSAPTTGKQESSAFYQRWWFWTAVGVVAAGAGLGIYLMAGQGTAGPNTALGSRKVF